MESDLLICEKFLQIENELASNLLKLNLQNCNVHTIYNPLEYAEISHETFVKTYMNSGPKKVLFLGMNPGPYGMGQTGVPFGQVTKTREFLKICCQVDKPTNEHPKRPIDGFQCKRNEVSGDRFWSFFEDVCGNAGNFFTNCIVYNHCPLLFMGPTGKNITPPELPLELRNQLYSLCDEALNEVIKLFECEHIIALGRVVEARAKKVVKEYKIENISVKFLVHPSPASPAANSGWRDLAYETLSSYQLLPLLQPHQAT